ncbi:MAG: monovalent cation/H+ antiporter complex subunit F [Sulfolobales archaeon]|nr:monovalent cation/H+ antiporter complex subunit F [Sulfolobales archaeon]MCX8186430.1 monovalent cation/H+ antiporter complex subunit F [Sulfolobales archaeon]MDW7969760.1 monovalent cation/H+ antiporter complex subunit F [Sulfolobales archaeon]
MDLESLVTLMILCTIPIFVTAYILYFIRILKGPTIPDRVLAVDALAFDLVVFLIVLGIYFKSPILPATAVVLALWTYAFDIFIAKYLERREMGE